MLHTTVGTFHVFITDSSVYTVLKDLVNLCIGPCIPIMNILYFDSCLFLKEGCVLRC